MHLITILNYKENSLKLSLSQKQKIDFIDMRKHQEQNKKPMSFHFKNDGHWTPKGHLLAASAISANFAEWWWWCIGEPSKLPTSNHQKIMDVFKTQILAPSEKEQD